MSNSSDDEPAADDVEVEEFEPDFDLPNDNDENEEEEKKDDDNDDALLVAAAQEDDVVPEVEDDDAEEEEEDESDENEEEETEIGKVPEKKRKLEENEEVEVGTCCFCGDECNIHSQSCGACARSAWRRELCWDAFGGFAWNSTASLTSLQANQ